MNPLLQHNTFALWLRENGLHHYFPDAVWLQILVGIAILFALVTLTGWIVDKVLIALVHRTLDAIGREQWSTALDTHHVFRSLGYLAAVMVVMVNLVLLPLDDLYRDLALRGPGEFLGLRQSGQELLRFADLQTDGGLVEQARDLAAQWQRQASPHVARHLQRWMRGRDDYLRS